MKDDIRIRKCIESIDEKVEKVVVLNTPSDEVRTIVSRLDVKTIEIDNNNLARAYNVGIETSSNSNVLLMDSDCVFDEGTIGRLYEGLSDAPISKGKVIFTYKSLTGKIIALSREYHVTDVINAYAPPLAFDKSIKNKIGGFYFDEDIFWTEDHEFDQRVKRHGLQIKYVPEATIRHDEISIKSDLKSSFNYGAGYFEGVKKGATEPCFMYGGSKTLLGSIVYDVGRVAALPLLFVDVTKKKGILPAAFMSVWMFTFTAGYYAQALFNILRKEKK
ncbi:MAG: glycosyltransferase [Nanoarchaeota archaeon]|nr:glycosyltransferase [Nanoarchaeota archaeon]